MEEGRQRPALLRWLALVTVVGFGGVGALLVTHAQHRDLDALVFGPLPWARQLLFGVAAGLGLGLFAGWLVDRPFMDAIRRKYTDLLRGLIGSWREVVLVSVCAGVGEELFFRGAIQFWLGIPLTAVLFVAIHGYLDPRSWRMSVYGVALTFGMMLLGWMAEHVGLLSTMIAHALIDVVLLGKLKRGT